MKCGRAGEGDGDGSAGQHSYLLLSGWRGLDRHAGQPCALSNVPITLAVQSVSLGVNATPNTAPCRPLVATPPDCRALRTTPSCWKAGVALCVKQVRSKGVHRGWRRAPAAASRLPPPLPPPAARLCCWLCRAANAPLLLLCAPQEEFLRASTAPGTSSSCDPAFRAALRSCCAVDNKQALSSHRGRPPAAPAYCCQHPAASRSTRQPWRTCTAPARRGAASWDATSRSPGTMLAFAAACVGIPYFLGDQVRARVVEGTM